MADKIKYRYALDEQGRTVCIDDVSENDKKLHTYYCIGCGATMIARTGKIKKWHFAHKGTEEHCNPETYLHKLAKHLVKEKFDNSDSFEISYYQDVRCSRLETCSFKEFGCHRTMLKTYDLKKYYDICVEEQPIGNFIADLLLTNSKNPSLTPILLEIQVTHECEEGKKESGLHIIEIPVQDEKGIKDLLKKELRENDAKDENKLGFVKFYGFQRKSKETMSLGCNDYIKRFYLYRDGSSDIEQIQCNCSSHKIYGSDVFEVCLEERYDSFAYYYGFLFAKQYGIIKEACYFCKYYDKKMEKGVFCDEHYCHLYKKYGTPQNPNQIYAQQCKYFRKDNEFIETMQSIIPKHTIPTEDDMDFYNYKQ
jgi:hypothetical protein